ncbi:MAG: hypothetical protein JKY65_32475 [Planctomycetes bacterium]|nr:hypothetical protein [Planctomycetota bacterium]
MRPFLFVALVFLLGSEALHAEEFPEFEELECGPWNTSALSLEDLLEPLAEEIDRSQALLGDMGVLAPVQHTPLQSVLVAPFEARIPTGLPLALIGAAVGALLCFRVGRLFQN